MKRVTTYTHSKGVLELFPAISRRHGYLCLAEGRVGGWLDVAGAGEPELSPRAVVGGWISGALDFWKSLQEKRYFGSVVRR